VLITLQNQQPDSRFGVVAGRSVGGAVQRNHCKRWMRNILDGLHDRIEPGWDCLFLARQKMSCADFQLTSAAMQGLLEKARLLRANSNDV